MITVEGSAEKSNLAKKKISELNIHHVNFVQSEFDDFLHTCNHYVSPLMVFFDGDHKYEATLRYFNEMLKMRDENSIFIFDDIRWSMEMERAWEKIVKSEESVITIDVFYMGIVLFTKNTDKKHYIINF